MKRIRKYFGIITTAWALTTFAAAESETQNVSQLVAADAVLLQNVDAKTATQGDTVKARLTESVHIADDTKLPHNTLLIGHIDEVQPSDNNGVSRVVLTFDRAQLANGQQITIKSTIVGVYPDGTDEDDLMHPSLNPDLKVYQEPSSRHGYALSSNVADSSSGTLSANGKDVRLKKQTELVFALAPVAGATFASAGK